MSRSAIFFLVLALSVGLIECSKRENPVDIVQPSGMYFSMEFQSNSIQGDVMQDFPRRNILVYTPPGFEIGDTTSYPVLYLLHGFGGDHNYFRGIYSVGQILDELINSGEVEPMLVVTPNATNNLGGSFYTNSPDFGNGSYAGLMEDFITEEVVSVVDSVFHTIPDRQHRGISGHSMGGYGAIKLAMSRSDLFASASSMSGPLAFYGMYPDTTFLGLVEFLPAVFAENNFTPGDTAAFYSITPGPGKSLTNMMFAMASAFSPHDPANADTSYAHRFATGQFVGYVDLPFDVSGSLVDTVWNLWLANDVATIFANGGAGVFDSTALYFDCGNEDDLSLNIQARVFDGLATTMGVSHQFVEYSGFDDIYAADHTMYIAERLKEVIKFHDAVFRQ